VRLEGGVEHVRVADGVGDALGAVRALRWLGRTTWRVDRDVALACLAQVRRDGVAELLVVLRHEHADHDARVAGRGVGNDLEGTGDLGVGDDADAGHQGHHLVDGLPVSRHEVIPDHFDHVGLHLASVAHREDGLEFAIVDEQLPPKHHVHLQRVLVLGAEACPRSRELQAPVLLARGDRGPRVLGGLVGGSRGGGIRGHREYSSLKAAWLVFALREDWQILAIFAVFVNRVKFKRPISLIRLIGLIGLIFSYKLIPIAFLT